MLPFKNFLNSHIWNKLGTNQSQNIQLIFQNCFAYFSLNSRNLMMKRTTLLYSPQSANLIEIEIKRTIIFHIHPTHVIRHRKKSNRICIGFVFFCSCLSPSEMSSFHIGMGFWAYLSSSWFSHTNIEKFCETFVRVSWLDFGCIRSSLFCPFW